MDIPLISHMNTWEWRVFPVTCIKTVFGEFS
jgi:hypothetical protein